MFQFGDHRLRTAAVDWFLSLFCIHTLLPIPVLSILIQVTIVHCLFYTNDLF